MSRLTNTDREKITVRAIRAAFAARDESLKQAEHALGMEAYEAVLPAAARVQAAAMPEGWCRMGSCLRFNANGWTSTLSVVAAVPVPHSSECRIIGTLTGELAERVQAHQQAGEKLRDERNRAERELDGFLTAFKTFKQMRDAWREGEPFYADLDVDRPASGVPAVRMAEINALLSIAA